MSQNRDNGLLSHRSMEAREGTCQSAPFVSVIIPNWNGAAHLPTCLESLRRQTWRDFEVIVVDNGSEDGSLELLAREYPEVRVLALGENRGFAGACNAGIRAAQGELIVLLNNDTEADPRWLEEVVAAFGRHPEAGIVASKMLLFDRRDTFHTAGDYYRVDGRPGNRGVWQTDRGQYDREEYVFSACGGSAAYRRSMLDDVGLLDEEFFYSCEDVDLAWRAQPAGWRCVYAPRAVVYHKLSATGGGPIASFYDGRNFLYPLVTQGLTRATSGDATGLSSCGPSSGWPGRRSGRGGAPPLGPVSGGMTWQACWVFPGCRASDGRSSAAAG